MNRQELLSFRAKFEQELKKAGILPAGSNANRFVHYAPHQGKREKARRLARLVKGLAACLVLVVVVALSGCATAPIYIPPSYPMPIMAAADVMTQVQPYVAPERIIAAEALPYAEKQIARDQFLSAVIMGTDANWYAYEGELFDQSQKAQQSSTLDTVLKVAGIGLGAAGALAGGGLIPLVAAPYLAGAAGTLLGVQGALKSTADPFFGRTLTTIDALMVAGRAGVLEEILICMDLPVEQCGIGQAVALAGAYYRAGSIPGALSEAGQQAAVKTVEVRARMKMRMMTRGVKQ